MILAAHSAKQTGNRDHPERSRDNTEETERPRFRAHEYVHDFGRDDEDRVAWRVWLVACHVEATHAKREVDRVEILERAWKVREVKREENEGERRESSHAAAPQAH